MFISVQADVESEIFYTSQQFHQSLPSTRNLQDYNLKISLHCSWKKIARNINLALSLLASLTDTSIIDKHLVIKIIVVLQKSIQLNPLPTNLGEHVLLCGTMCSSYFRTLQLSLEEASCIGMLFVYKYHLYIACSHISTRPLCSYCM